MRGNIEQLCGLLQALPDGEAIAARILGEISATLATRSRAAVVADEPADDGRDISLRAAARLVGVGVPRLQRLIGEGKLSARHVGGSDREPWLKVNPAEVRRVWREQAAYKPAGVAVAVATLPVRRASRGAIHPALSHL